MSKAMKTVSHYRIMTETIAEMTSSEEVITAMPSKKWHSYSHER